MVVSAPAATDVRGVPYRATLLIAGHETTAAVLTWTTYLLATHPEIKARVQAEVRASHPPQPEPTPVLHTAN